MTYSKINQIKWRGKNLEYLKNYEQSSKKEGREKREVYVVLGFKNSLREYEPIPIKLQKNCRAFLRGTRRTTGIKGLDKIIFSK